MPEIKSRTMLIAIQAGAARIRTMREELADGDAEPEDYLPDRYEVAALRCRTAWAVGQRSCRVARWIVGATAQIGVGVNMVGPCLSRSDQTLAAISTVARLEFSRACAR